jgi:hypothetical protein
VGRRIGLIIGLDLDDASADARNEQRRPNQVRRNLMDAAAEKASPYRSSHIQLSQQRCLQVNRRLTGRSAAGESVALGQQTWNISQFSHCTRAERRFLAIGFFDINATRSGAC